MKRTLSRARLLASAVFLSLILAACAGGNSGLSGTYVPEDSGDPVLTFSGDKVTMIADIGLGEELELTATYKISGDTITFSFDKSALETTLRGSDLGAAIQSDLGELTDMVMEQLNGAFTDSPFSREGDKIEIDASVYYKE